MIARLELWWMGVKLHWKLRKARKNGQELCQKTIGLETVAIYMGIFQFTVWAIVGCYRAITGYYAKKESLL